MEYQSATLACGLKIIYAPSLTDVVYCGFSINAGTRDEKEEESGMAHFCEHLLFKGTPKRRSWHILNRMENVGGDLNAYTNKEETVVYAAFLKEHFPRAVDLLTDIVFRSTFPQNEMKKEVEVVIDEIASYDDSPSELIFDDFENMIFKGHALGRNILGNPEELRRYTSEDALSFTRRYYSPENMVFFVLGKVDFKQVVRLLEKAVNESPLNTTASPVVRLAPPSYEPQQLTVQKNTHQSHVLIGSRCYNAYDPKRIGLYLLSNILGGPGMNSRLNISLREKRGLVYTVESNSVFYTDTGTFCIYFGCDQADTDHCMALTRKELDKLMKEPLSSSQLATAKKQIKGQIGVACDNFENWALSFGKTFLRYGTGKNIQQLYNHIDSLTALELQDIAQEIFSEQNLSILTYK